MGDRVDSNPAMSDNPQVDSVEFVSVSLRVIKRKPMPEAGDVPAFLRQNKMYTPSQETVWVLAYDTQGSLRRVSRIAQGSYDTVDVPIPAIITAVALAAADRFWLVHNHPGGSVSPSPADVDLTAKVLNAANTCGMRMEDHLIIAPPDQVFSFREARLIRTPDEVTGVAANERMVIDPIIATKDQTNGLGLGSEG